MMRFLATFLLSIAVISGMLGASGETWNKAAEAYRSGNYLESLALYRSLEKSVQGDEVLYNIGNCYYQLDSIPQSILYFEKAVKLNARNDEAIENLELARSKMDEPVIGIEQFFLLRWVMAVALSISPLGWGLIVLALLWLAALGYVRAIRTKGELRLRDRVIPVLVILIVMFLGYVSYHQTVRDDYGVIMDTVSLNGAPDDLSPVLRSLEGGEKVHILDSLDGYFKIRLVNFEVGWVPEGVVQRI